MGHGTLLEEWDGSGTLQKVRNGSRDIPGGPEQVEGISRKSGTARDVLQKVRDGSGGPQKVWDGSGTFPKVWDGSRDPPGGPRWVGGPSQRSGTDREVLRKVWNGLGYSPGRSERVGGPSRRSGTVRGTLQEVRDGS